MAKRTRRSDRKKASPPTTRPSVMVEPLEPRLLLSADITGISSALSDFRFVTGSGVPALYNSYEAAIVGAPSRVEFDLGGQSIIDTNGADGWSALFNMSSLVPDSDLVVRAFEGATQADSYSLPVDMIALPDWMKDGNVELDISASPSSGYHFDVYVKNLDYGFSTPSDWQWDLPYFDTPLVDLSNLRTGFDTGWTFDIQSTPGGTTYVYDTGYHLGMEVLGKDVWDYDLRTGTSNSFSVGPATGTYSVALSPGVSNDLTLNGLTASAAFDLDIDRTVHLPSFSVANAFGLPSWIVDIQCGLSFGIGIGLGASVSAALDNGHFELSAASIVPDVEVHVIGRGEANAGGGYLAKAGIEIDGAVTQEFAATYSGGSWNFDAPGSLGLSGSLYWDTFLSAPGEYDLFEWTIADWNFVDASGSGSQQDRLGQTPYNAPTVQNNAASSFDPSNATERPMRFTIDATADHASGINWYGYLLERWLGGEWRVVSADFSEAGVWEVGPLAVGEYRLQTMAENAYGGFGYSTPEYFYVPYVGPQEGSDLSIQSWRWSDERDAYSDGDGIPEAGENVDLQVKLRNLAGEQVRNVTAFLATPIGNVKITDERVFYDRLDPGDSSWANDEYDMFLDFASTWHNLPFRLHVEYMKGDYEYYQEFTFNDTLYEDGVLSPAFEVVGYTVDDSVSYGSRNNGDGVFQSGENIRIRPQLRNTGNVAATDVWLVATSDSTAFVEFPSGEDEAYPDLGPGQSAYPIDGGDFRVYSVDSRFTGMVPVSFRVLWANDNCVMDLPNALYLEIEPASVLRVYPNDADFGVVAPGDEVVETIEVRNYGSAPLTVTNIVTSHADTSVSETSFVVSPGDSRQVTVTIDTSAIPNGTTLARTIQVIAPDARVSDPGEDDRMVLGGLVSERAEIAVVPGADMGRRPDISGNWLVWYDSRYGNSDIFARNLVTGEEIQVTTDASGQYDAFVSGSLIVWEDNRHWDGTSDTRYRGVSVYGYDLDTREEFCIASGPFTARVIGVDGGRIAVTQGYDLLYDRDGQEDELASNCKVYQYQGNGQVTAIYDTGWVAGSGHDTRQNAQADGDFGNGMLIFERHEYTWRDNVHGGYWSMSEGDQYVVKIDYAAGETSPTRVTDHFYWPYSAASHSFAYVQYYEDPQGNEGDQIWLWDNGSVRRLTSPGTEEIDHADDILAMGGGFVVYDKRGETELFFQDLSTGQEFLLTDQLTYADAARMDGNIVVWEGWDASNAKHLYYTMIRQPDMSIVSADILVSDSRPREGDSMNVTAVVRNVTDYSTTADVVVRLYDGDPENGGMQLRVEQVLSGGVVGQGSRVAAFTDVVVPDNNGVGASELRRLYVQVTVDGYDDPANNTAQAVVEVFDDDTEAPVISGFSITEYNGDGDGIIGSDEQAIVSWDVSDPSGIGSVELFLDGGAVVIGGQSSAVIGPLGVGTHEVTVIASDADNSPEAIAADRSFGVVAADAISIRYDGAAIYNGQISPVEFGSAAQGASPRHCVVMIYNDGQQALSIDSVTGPTGFIVSDTAASVIPEGGSTYFTVALDTTSAGYYSGHIEVVSSDSDQGTFVFPIEGEVIETTVAGRFVFYNNSPMDGSTSGASSQDDNAIAVGKQALMPGDTGSGANCTAYSKGLNGIMVDIDGLANPGGLSLATIGDYFGFRAGTSGDPSGWGSAPTPTAVDVRSVGGNSRVTIIWADNAIEKKWLQVTVKAGAATGLSNDDVFYFGNMPGDATGDGVTNGFDLLRVRQNYLMPPGGGRDDTADVTMDGNVNGFDLLAVRQNYLQSLPMISTPAAPTGGMAMTSASFEETVEALAIQPVTMQIAPVVEQVQVAAVPTTAGAAAAITASFNRPVSVAPAALEIVSPVGLRVELPAFRYEPVTRTAKWTTAGLSDGLYQGVIRSSSILADGVSMARDSQFRFRLTGGIITDLQEDTNGDGIINLLDLLVV